MRIGWLADQLGYKGGAELEADYLAACAPAGVTLVSCPAGDVVAGLDAYVVHNCASYPRRTLEALRGKPVVKRLHDLWSEGSQAMRSYLLAEARLMLLSSPIQHSFVPWKVTAPVAYIPSAIAASTFHPNGQARHGAVWLGRLAWGKGLENARRWAMEHRQEVDVWGYGALEKDIQPPLRMCGPVEPSDVPALLAQYETFVFLPDNVEPYGRTVAEAWLAGCQVVTNGLVGAAWWIADNPAAVSDGAGMFWRKVMDVIS